MDERPRTGEDGASFYDTHSTRSASTSSRATVNGPRQRPKGPRTSDISRSSLVERANLPLSPLSKEVQIVSQELPYPAAASSTPVLPPKQDDIPLISPKPSRRSVARFSFRRSKSKSQQHEDTYVDDPFRAIPHSSVRQAAPSQQAEFSADSVDLSAQPKRSLSLMTPVSRSESTVPLKPKRSFFRRMADKFTRASSTPSPKSDFQKDRTERIVKHQASLSYTTSPAIFVSPQLPTPASPTQSSPFVPPSLFVVPPDELSSVHSHEDSITRTPSFVRLPESLSVRSLPVIATDDQTVDNITFSRPNPPSRMPSLNSSLYHLPSTSRSSQPVTPISPVKRARTPGHNDLGDPVHPHHTSISEHPSPRLGNVQSSLPYKEKAVSMRNVPVIQSPPMTEKRKAMSVRSRMTDLPRTSSLSVRELQEGEKYSLLNKRYNICEDSQVLVNLDKAMFEKELVRETERKMPKRGKSAPDKIPAEESIEIEPHLSRYPTMSLMGREPKRQSNGTLNDRKHLRLTRPLKPSSAPNPSSPGPQRGLAFSVNLETNSEVNIPSSALIIDPSPHKTDRLYPDVLYTASQSDGQLSRMLNHDSSRQSSPMQPSSKPLSQTSRSANEDSSRRYIANGRDKVSRWLASTSQSTELNGSANASSFTRPNSGFTSPDELEEYTPEYGDKRKGKAPVRPYCKV